MRFKNLTVEERSELNKKAQAAKRAKTASRRKSTLCKDFLDADVWLELAKKHEIRLPPWGEPCTVSSVRTQIHKLNMSQHDWEEMNGCKVKEWIENNPDWPLRAFVGLMLEEK